MKERMDTLSKAIIKLAIELLIVAVVLIYSLYGRMYNYSYRLGKFLSHPGIQLALDDRAQAEMDALVESGWEFRTCVYNGTNAHGITSAKEKCVLIYSDTDVSQFYHELGHAILFQKGTIDKSTALTLLSYADHYATQDYMVDDIRELYANAYRFYIVYGEPNLDDWR